MKFINNKPIAILLGAYNGSDYIEEQIESLLSQTNQDWTLYIRDDNSTDNTRQIVTNYAKKYSNIILLEDNKGNLGCKQNFFDLLNSVDSKYYMFCDHDDVWLPFKIEKTYSKILELEKLNPEQSIIVFSDLKVVDSDLKEIASSFWKYSKINPNILNSFRYISIYNLVTGCTMIINKKVVDTVVPFPIYAIMHDSYITLKTVAMGGILGFISDQTILYRQHTKNVIGATNYNQNYLITKLRNIKKVIKNNIAHYKMVNNIIPTSIFKFLFFKFLYILKR